jgi:2-dehydro-3-deoxyglucarate aldolase
MKNTLLKEKLQNNELTIGSWITIGHPSIPEILSSAGFEWLAVDIEHNSIDNSMIQTLISTIQSKNIAALVRISKNDEVAIKHAMDAGADGIIVPMINTKEDAEKAVEYVKYPPLGRRGVGLSRAQNYGFGFDQYREWLLNSAVIIAQIEHIDAVENIEKIISVEGIDGVLIGPYDLSGSLGKPGDFSEPDYVNAIGRVEKHCKKKNFPLGIHVIEPNEDLLISKINNGFTFIAFSTDFYFMGENAIRLMNLL